MQFRRNSSLFRQQNWYTSLFLLFSHSAMSDSLQLHGLQQDRLPGPSVSPRICSKSCPLSQWCHPTFSTCLLLLLPSIFSSIRVFASRWPSENKKKNQNKTLPSETHISWIRHAVCLVSFSRPPSLLLLLWFYFTIPSNGICKWGSSALMPNLILPFVGFILSWIKSLLLETNEIIYKGNTMRQKMPVWLETGQIWPWSSSANDPNRLFKTRVSSFSIFSKRG